MSNIQDLGQDELEEYFNPDDEGVFTPDPIVPKDPIDQDPKGDPSTPVHPDFSLDEPNMTGGEGVVIDTKANGWVIVTGEPNVPFRSIERELIEKKFVDCENTNMVDYINDKRTVLETQVDEAIFGGFYFIDALDGQAIDITATINGKATISSLNKSANPNSGLFGYSNIQVYLHASEEFAGQRIYLRQDEGANTYGIGGDIVADIETNVGIVKGLKVEILNLQEVGYFLKLVCVYSERYGCYMWRAEETLESSKGGFAMGGKDSGFVPMEVFGSNSIKSLPIPNGSMVKIPWGYSAQQVEVTPWDPENGLGLDSVSPLTIPSNCVINTYLDDLTKPGIWEGCSYVIVTLMKDDAVSAEDAKSSSISYNNAYSGKYIY